MMVLLMNGKIYNGVTVPYIFLQSIKQNGNLVDHQNVPQIMADIVFFDYVARTKNNNLLQVVC